MENYNETINSAFNAYYQGNMSEALKLFYKILADDLMSSVNYYNVALVYDSLREYELAVSYYKKSIRLDGTNIRSMNNLARIYIEEIKDFEIAEVYLNQAVEIAPNDAEAYNLFGNLSMLKSDYELALRYFKKAILLDKNYFKNYYDIGVCYFALNQYEEAKTNVKKSLELNPKFSIANELLQQIP